MVFCGYLSFGVSIRRWNAVYESGNVGVCESWGCKIEKFWGVELPNTYRREQFKHSRFKVKLKRILNKNGGRLDTIQEYETQFENGMKKNIGTKIANFWTGYSKEKVTVLQCENNYKRFKRTYENIAKYNNGKVERNFIFFDIINDERQNNKKCILSVNS